MTLTELEKIKNIYKVLEIAVDFINPSYNISRAKHLDNARYIVCTLTENGIPRKVKENEVARIRLQKPDGTYVYNDCAILEDGRVFITLTEQILAVEGNAICDIQLTDEETGIIYSCKNFIINIDKTSVDNSVIESSDEFDALNSLIATNKKLNKELKANEEVRQTNENERIENENIRNTAEKTRQKNETARINDENIRESNETVRQNQETNRENNTSVAIENAKTATKKANDATDDLQNKLNSHHFVLTEDKDIAGGIPSLDNNAKIPLTELYDATTSNKGITQLTDSITSTSTTTAATPKSVKTVNDALMTEVSRAKTELSNHNFSTTAHTDIRELIISLTNRLNALADSDDTTLDQLSEIVAYIKSNRTLIESVTINKINVSDIVDSLTSMATNKPLSANQGKLLKGLIDNLESALGIHTSNSDIHITSDERTNWNDAKIHADSTHAPSNAQANQNAFSNIAVDSTTIAAGAPTDTLTLVAGSNVTITPDAANGKITISSTGGSGSDINVRQKLYSENYNLPLLMSYQTNTNTTTNVDNITFRNSNIYANPSTGTIYSTAYEGTAIKVASDKFEALKIMRNSTGFAALTFENTNGVLGYIGMHTPGMLCRIAADGTSAILLDTNNYKDYAAPKTHNHSSILDSNNSNMITFAYSKSGLSNADWLAAWDGYELRAISPANVLKSIGAAPEEHTHDTATTSASGLMSAADKTKLDAQGTIISNNGSVTVSSINTTYTLTSINFTVPGVYLVKAEIYANANVSVTPDVSMATFGGGAVTQNWTISSSGTGTSSSHYITYRLYKIEGVSSSSYRTLTATGKETSTTGPSLYGIIQAIRIA